MATVDWPQAERLSLEILFGGGVRSLLNRLTCTKCGFKHMSIEFQMLHFGPTPWSGVGDTEGRRRDPHRTNRGR